MIDPNIKTLTIKPKEIHLCTSEFDMLGFWMKDYLKLMWLDYTEYRLSYKEPKNPGEHFIVKYKLIND